MFKRLFSKEADKPAPANPDGGSRAKGSATIEENSGDSAAIVVNSDP